jgi:DNA polymerase (family 10)
METRIPLDTAKEYAAKVVNELYTACQRIEIAGSIRRNRATVGDIEIVCIPIDRFFQSGSLEERIAALSWKPIKNGSKYKQLDIGLDVPLDLFITTPECWGVIYTLRTGSAEFSHWLVKPRRYGGGCPAYIKVKDGRVWQDGKTAKTPEEADFFKAMGLAWVPPEKRETDKTGNFRVGK